MTPNRKPIQSKGQGSSRGEQEVYTELLETRARAAKVHEQLVEACRDTERKYSAMKAMWNENQEAIVKINRLRTEYEVIKEQKMKILEVIQDDIEYETQAVAYYRDTARQDYAAGNRGAARDMARKSRMHMARRDWLQGEFNNVFQEIKDASVYAEIHALVVGWKPYDNLKAEYDQAKAEERSLWRDFRVIERKRMQLEAELARLKSG